MADTAVLNLVWILYLLRLFNSTSINIIVIVDLKRPCQCCERQPPQQQRCASAAVAAAAAAVEAVAAVAAVAAWAD